MKRQLFAEDTIKRIVRAIPSRPVIVLVEGVAQAHHPGKPNV
jgi:hypothetical protein